jgi:hypothetical protein
MASSWDELRKEIEEDFRYNLRSAQAAAGWPETGPNDDTWSEILEKMDDIILDKVCSHDDKSLLIIAATAPEWLDLTRLNENGEGNWEASDHIEANTRDALKARYRELIKLVGDVGYDKALQVQRIRRPKSGLKRQMP